MKLKEVYKYIVSDYTRYWGKPKNSIVVFFRALSGIWPGFTYSFWMRLCYSGGDFWIGALYVTPLFT